MPRKGLLTIVTSGKASAFTSMKIQPELLDSPTKRESIDYIADHRKATAFDGIKRPTNFRYPNPYSVTDEMIQKLDEMFGTHDKVGKSNFKINDPKFGMGVRINKGTFVYFHARFSANHGTLNLRDL